MNVAPLPVTHGVLAVRLPETLRCLSSSVLGGGLGEIRTWLNVQVPPTYGRTDPAAHLQEVAARRGDPPPIVGMLTAADVTRRQRASSGGATAVATVGLGQPLAAAGRRPRRLPAVGTINLLVVVDEPLSPAGLVNAVQTAAEAKAQALADARIPAANGSGWATGTATDALCVVCPPGPAPSGFAGPATRVGGAIATSVHAAVAAGAARERRDVVAGACR